MLYSDCKDTSMMCHFTLCYYVTVYGRSSKRYAGLPGSYRTRCYIFPGVLQCWQRVLPHQTL